VQAEIESRPLLYGNFMTFQEDTPIYDSIPNYEVLRKTLDAKLAEYNESNPAMDLVLFQQVCTHSFPVYVRTRAFMHAFHEFLRRNS
jgi:dynein heavy chain, axonemal